MEDGAWEEDPADEQPSDEECEVPAHRSSSVGDGGETPVSGPSASPAVSMDHSPRPRGFGRGTPTSITEQNTVSRSGSSADQQARGNPRCQSLSSPMLTRSRSTALSPPLPDSADCSVPGITTVRGPPEHVTLRWLVSQSATTTETPSAENNGQAEALEN